MARNKANQANIDGSDLFNYPDKRIKNNTGAGDGTPVNEQVYGDIHEFHAKLMRDAKIPFNDIPDNTSNGYQYVESLFLTANKNNIIIPLDKSSNTECRVNLDLSILKDNEALILKSNFKSDDNVNVILGTKGSSKNLYIVGNFDVNQKVRIINNGNIISIAGLYDTQNLPNVIQRMTNIENSFLTITKVMSVFQKDGAMVFWNKPANQIPDGWREVVDWRGRFPVGMDVNQDEFKTLGLTAGEKSVKLTQSNLPKTEGIFPSLAPTQNNGSGIITLVNSGTAQVGGSVSPLVQHKDFKIGFGGDSPHNNLPPYRTVLFIEYIG